MSNYLSIATVTASLRNYLLQALPAEIASATATAVRPDAESSALPGVGVNIYLYQLNYNNALTQHTWPNRSSAGLLQVRPGVGLELQYVLSFYGDEATLEPQRVLGAVVHRLNTQPILDPELIRSTVSDPFFPYLAGSDLAEAPERVRLTPLSFSAEEMTKFWSGFEGTNARMSLLYNASVVFVESQTQTQRALPVYQRNIGVTPFSNIQLNSAKAQGPLADQTVSGATIQLTGSGFTTPLQSVDINYLSFSIDSIESPTTLLFQLTHPELRAGIVSLRLRATSGFRTPALPFMVRPQITPGAPGAGMLSVQFTPEVGRDQNVELILNQINPPPGEQSRSFVIPAPDNNGIADPLIDSTNEISFPLDSVTAGTYLLRAVVDGAENLLTHSFNGSHWQFSDTPVVIP